MPYEPRGNPPAALWVSLPLLANCCWLSRLPVFSAVQREHSSRRSCPDANGTTSLISQLSAQRRQDRHRYDTKLLPSWSTTHRAVISFHLLQTHRPKSKFKWHDCGQAIPQQDFVLVHFGSIFLCWHWFLMIFISVFFSHISLLTASVWRLLWLYDSLWWWLYSVMYVNDKASACPQQLLKSQCFPALYFYKP